MKSLAAILVALAATPAPAQDEGLREELFRPAPFRSPDPEPEAPPVRQSNSLPADGAVLRGLDKFAGLTRTFEVSVGETVEYARLRVTLRACRRPPPEEGEDAFAYLEIVDMKAPDQIAFQGWMYASSPALSALDHPRFDVWVLSCSTASGDPS